MKPLNPLMAAVLAASSAAFMLPGTAFSYFVTDCSNGGPNCVPVQPAGALPVPTSKIADASPAAALTGDCLKTIKTETDPRNAMTCLVATQAGATKDIGARFAEFLQAKDFKGRGYLTPKLRKDKTLLPAVIKEAQDWPEKNKKDPAAIAILYIVVGPGSAGTPAWVATSPALAESLTSDTNTKLSRRLAISLAGARWTDKNQISQSGAANAVDAFFLDAANRAYTVFQDTRTESEATGSVEQNKPTDGNPPEVGGGTRKNPLDSSGAGFSFDDMYGKPGAVVEDVWGDKDDGYRRISMKMYTVKQDDGSLKTMVGIVDITPGDPNTPYAPTFFPVTQSGNSVVSLRDGGRKYSLVIGMTPDGQHNITFSRGSGHPLTTSMEDLAGARADQAATGGIVTIAGQKYYALGQGGVHGAVLFFPKDDIDNRAGTKDPISLRPVAMGSVSKLDGDGRTVPMDGTPDIGMINGKNYRLEFDFATKMWQVKEGVGTDKPKPVDTAKSTATVSGAPAADGQIVPAPVPGSTLEQAVALAKAGGYVEAEGNAGFNADVRSKIRIMKSKANGAVVYTVFFDPSLGVTNGQIVIPNSVGDKPENLQAQTGVRGYDDYIVFEYSKSKEYLSFPNFLKWAKAEKVTPDMLLDPDPKVGMQGVPSMGMALDMLNHYFGLSQAEKDKLADPADGLAARAAKVAQGDGYTISGNGKLVYLTQGVGNWKLWPELKKTENSGSNAGMTGLRGPGTAVAVVGGGPAGFQKSMEMGGGHTITLIKTQDHAALYTGPEDEILPDGTPQTSNLWYMMIEYKKNGRPARTKPLPVFGGHDRMALPKGYEMQGLAGLDLPDTTQLMLLHGSTQEKGAIAAYRYDLPDSQGGTNTRGKAGNCAGPVIWWGGVTKAQAQKACEGDSKVP